MSDATITSEIRKARRAVTIKGLTRTIGRTVEHDGERVVVHQHLGVIQHDVSEHEGIIFWRGAAIGVAA